MRTSALTLLAGAALTSGLAVGMTAGMARPAAAAADAGHGQALFGQRCAMCHSTDGSAKIGPSLAGVVGRKAGSVSGFTYSSALKASNLTWTKPSLDKFLTAPAKMVPGTRMAVSIPSQTDRADMVAYLATLKRK